jgi:hypothetical protein
MRRDILESVTSQSGTVDVIFDSDVIQWTATSSRVIPLLAYQ